MTSTATAALLPLVVQGIREASGRFDFVSIADALTSSTSAYHLEFDDQQHSVLIDFRDQRTASERLAGDCCRLAMASFQTMGSLPHEFTERDNAVWGLVKLYYSAFYAGNAIIRLFGETCSYFDKQHIDRLRDFSELLGTPLPTSVSRGLYHCALSDMTILKCKLIGGGPQGSHENFWQIFGRCIKRIGDAILESFPSQIEPQTVFAQLGQLNDIIRRGSGFSWLSLIRNEMQYRQQHGVWFPAKMKKRDRNGLSRIAIAWRGDPMSISLTKSGRGSLVEFTSASVFIVALCHALLIGISQRSSSGAKCFVNYGPIAYLNEARPRTPLLPAEG